MSELCSEQLKLYSSVSETSVKWLWYPYIPLGKVSIIQGDPGSGKSTLMMSIIASLSTGERTSVGIPKREPIHVIYQCSEDGVSDTIKPRLRKAGANCDNVAFLNEELDAVTLNDDKLLRAIVDFNAKLLVIDPFQAYLGDAESMNNVSIRKVIRRLGLWASMYDCAVVLVGHLNKKQNNKDLYRGLGSIDIIAGARSVLQVSVREESEIRALQHIKSSLAPKGDTLFFTIDSKNGIEWIDEEDCESNNDLPFFEKSKSKQEKVAEKLLFLLSKGPIKASEINNIFVDDDVSIKTIRLTKKFLGIESFRTNGEWYWSLPYYRIINKTNFKAKIPINHNTEDS